MGGFFLLHAIPMVEVLEPGAEDANQKATGGIISGFCQKGVKNRGWVWLKYAVGNYMHFFVAV